MGRRKIKIPKTVQQVADLLCEDRTPCPLCNAPTRLWKKDGIGRLVDLHPELKDKLVCLADGYLNYVPHYKTCQKYQEYLAIN